MDVPTGFARNNNTTARRSLRWIEAGFRQRAYSRLSARHGRDSGGRLDEARDDRVGLFHVGVSGEPDRNQVRHNLPLPVNTAFLERSILTRFDSKNLRCKSTTKHLSRLFDMWWLASRKHRRQTAHGAGVYVGSINPMAGRCSPLSGTAWRWQDVDSVSHCGSQQAITAAQRDWK